MKEINIGFGSPVDENLIARADRQQVATDIGRISKMLLLSAFMLPQSSGLDKNDSLYRYSQIIRTATTNIVSEIIGQEAIKFDGTNYVKYYPDVPDEIEKYMDYAGMIIATFVDGVLASKYYDEENLKIMKQYLEKNYELIEDFNKYANRIHKIADITYIDKKDNGLKR